MVAPTGSKYHSNTANARGAQFKELSEPKGLPSLTGLAEGQRFNGRRRMWGKRGTAWVARLEMEAIDLFVWGLGRD